MRCNQEDKKKEECYNSTRKGFSHNWVECCICFMNIKSEEVWRYTVTSHKTCMDSTTSYITKDNYYACQTCCPTKEDACKHFLREIWGLPKEEPAKKWWQFWKGATK